MTTTQRYSVVHTTTEHKTQNTAQLQKRTVQRCTVNKTRALDAQKNTTASQSTKSKMSNSPGTTHSITQIHCIPISGPPTNSDNFVKT